MVCRIFEEIDFIIFLKYFQIKKLKICFILLIVMLFGLIYNLFFIRPLYEYVTIIKIPESVNLNIINNCIYNLKSDVGQFEGLKEVNFIVKDKTLKIVFQGQDYKKLNNLGNIYDEKALLQINSAIQKEFLDIDELEDIKYELQNISAIGDLNNENLQILTETINKLETCINPPQAEILNKNKEHSYQVESKFIRNMIITFFIGVLLSIVLITSEYLYYNILLMKSE